MSLPQPVKRFTAAEYYELEHSAEYRSDFYVGEIFAMAGGTARHSAICTNLCGELRQRLKGNRCAAYESNLRIKISATGLRTYPDASVFCEPLERDEEDPYQETYTNPTILFEVLSKSTEGYDRGLKAQSYRRIPSLQAYVLVAQDKAFLEIHERQPDNRWTITEVEGLGKTAKLSAIGIELPLAEVYERIEFAAVEGASE